MVKLTKTAFRDCKFKDSKLLGLRFEDCDGFLFSAGFEDCRLNLSSFYKMKLKKTIFKNSSLHEVDFTEADLTSSFFHNCDLERSIFENSIVEKAHFRTAYNYSINPEITALEKRSFQSTV